MKRPCILFMGLLVLSSFTLALAGSEEDPEMDVGEGIKEIIKSINEIIKYSIKLAEAELKELQRELKEGGRPLEKQAEKSILQALKRILAELRRLEEALKKNMAEREGLSKEELDRYMKDRDKLEERVGQFRERIKGFAEEIGKDWRLMKEPIGQRVQDILKEMERAIDRMGERLKRQRQMDKTIYTLSETLCLCSEHQLRKS
jgi:Na+/phosphate symporter